VTWPLGTTIDTTDYCGAGVWCRVWYQGGLVPQRPIREVTRKIPEARKSHPVAQFFSDVPSEDASAHLEFLLLAVDNCSPVCTIRRFGCFTVVCQHGSSWWFFTVPSPISFDLKLPTATLSRRKNTIFLIVGEWLPFWHVLLPGWRRITRLALGWKRDCLQGLDHKYGFKMVTNRGYKNCQGGRWEGTHQH
jgi:hypothetical protein